MEPNKKCNSVGCNNKGVLIAYLEDIELRYCTKLYCRKYGKKLLRYIRKEQDGKTVEVKWGGRTIKRGSSISKEMGVIKR